MIQSISVQQLHTRINNKEDNFYLLDVREPNEVAICDIENAHHIPMSLIAIYIDQIPDDRDIIIYCHHGRRSLTVANYLIENGFDASRIYNLDGGIDHWALEIAPIMRRY